jgi:ATP-dependent RNA helicase DeaD
MAIPTGEQISNKRVQDFREKVVELTRDQKVGEALRPLLENIALEEALDIADIAAALAYLVQEDQPLFPVLAPIEEKPRRERGLREEREPREPREFGERRERAPRERDSFGVEGVEAGFERYYIGVGRIDNISPRDIVGAIANEADISSQDIGRIKLHDRFSTVELPEGMPADTLEILQAMTIRNRPSKFRLMTDEPPPREEHSDRGFGGDRGDRGGFRGDRDDRRGGGGFGGGFGGGRGGFRDRGDRGGFGGGGFRGNRDDRRGGGFGERRERSFGDRDRGGFRGDRGGFGGGGGFRKDEHGGGRTRRFGRH